MNFELSSIGCSRASAWRARMLRLGCAQGLALLLIASGCSKTGLETAEVRGTVKLNGAPIQKGTVMFVPAAGRAGVGVIDQNGTFYVTTYRDGDGAVVGENKIAVFVPLDENAPQQEMAKHRLPPKYASTASSGLAWNVKPGQVNEVHLELTSN